MTAIGLEALGQPFIFGHRSHSFVALRHYGDERNRVQCDKGKTMNPHVSFITLGVTDLQRAKQFYSDGLGCPIQPEHAGFVSFALGNGSSGLALYTWDALAADAGVAADGSGFSGITLSCLVATAENVDELLAKAKSAGGKIAKPAQIAQWSGYFGYFADPDGYLWKVVSNT
jgi:predicted lactoylglutathione lyase